MQKSYYDCDCNLKILGKKIIAAVGFGNQDRAHALSQKDSKANVVIGLHDLIKNKSHVLELGFEVLSAANETRRDEPQAWMYKSEIEPKGFGRRDRGKYIKDSEISSLVVIYQDFTGNRLKTVMAYDAEIGLARVAIVVIFGGICELIKAGFEMLANRRREMALKMPSLNA